MYAESEPASRLALAGFPSMYTPHSSVSPGSQIFKNCLLPGLSTWAVMVVNTALSDSIRVVSLRSFISAFCFSWCCTLESRSLSPGEPDEFKE